MWCRWAWAFGCSRRQLNPTPLLPLADAPSHQCEIPLCQRLEDRTYDFGCVYTCANPIVLDAEIRIYYGASDYLHGGWREGCLALAHLRPDGFAGYRALDSSQVGRLITAKVSYTGQVVRLSADVEEGGCIYVTAVDADGAATARAKEAVTATCTDLPLTWDSEPMACRESR